MTAGGVGRSREMTTANALGHPPEAPSTPIAYRVYGGLMDLAAPLWRGWLAHRAKAGKEIAARLGEREGRASRARPAGALLWVHGASVGESLAAIPLIERLLADAPHLSVLVTTGTVTSARLLDERLPPRAFHQFLPVDRPRAVGRFLDHWRPDGVIWLESELWPTLLLAIGARAIPAALVNARLSERSAVGWGKRPRLFHALMRTFIRVLPVDAPTQHRLEGLGLAAGPVVNLKLGAAPLPVDAARLAEMTAAMGARPAWLAAQTGPAGATGATGATGVTDGSDSEEILAARVHKALAGRFPGLLTIIVPRHPDRGAKIAQNLAALGLAVAQRSAGTLPRPDTEIYLADTMGELGLFYRLSVPVFLGRSLVPLGGSNPVEPARLGCAVVQGPYTHNFADLEAALAPAMRRAESEAALTDAVAELIADPAAAAALGARAKAIVEAMPAPVDRVLTEITPVLAAIARSAP